MFSINKNIYSLFFYGVQFNNISFSQLKNKFGKSSLLLCFPAAPALINIVNDYDYLAALKKSDYNFFDSGFFVLLLRLTGYKVKKFSGLKFLKEFLFFLKKNNSQSILLIDPSDKESKKNKIYIRKFGVRSITSYVAPLYKNNYKDLYLLKILNKVKPSYIIINIGGGTQEKLGLWIKKNYPEKITIICTGAAIGFITGSQSRIPKIMDEFYLGWLVRCFHNPSIFVKRYFLALKFFYIFLSNFKTIKVNKRV